MEDTGIMKFNWDTNAQVQFVSEDCGERYIFSDLKILEYDFDSVRIVNPTPTAPASTNIEIYRCPRTNLMGIDFTTRCSSGWSYSRFFDGHISGQ